MAPDSSSRSYTGAVSLLVLAVAFTGLFLGVENWWVAFVVGYGAVVPLVAMLTGEDEDSVEAHGAESSTTNATQRVEDDRGHESKQDAMETLRERYATGELTEAQFERKLEALLETETLEDARDRIERNRRDGPGDDEPSTPPRTSEAERDRDRDVEYE